MSNDTLFIADLHLDASHPEITQQFLSFLQTTASHADALYILGDLFEVWVGDDDNDPHHQQVMQALHELTQSGIDTYLMHGNRDFLIGEVFARQTGITLLPDPVIVDVYNHPVLLMHGDLLCTDDTDYQQFRAMVREPQWQQQFLSLALEERYKIARNYRQQSQAASSQKSETIMDVAQTTVEQYLQEFQTPYLLHGHTHRPGLHEFMLDNVARTRIVVGDWYTQGSVLKWNSSGFDLQSLPRN